MTKKGIEDAIEADLAGDPIQPPHATPEADYDPNNPEHRKYWPQHLIEVLHAERASQPTIEPKPKAQARPNGSAPPPSEGPPEPPPPTDGPPPRQKSNPKGSGKGPPRPPHSNTKSAGNDNLRIPKNEETERYALAWVIRNPRKFLTAAQRLKPDHFYSEHHRNIFLCMHALATQGLAVDVPHVIAELKTRGQLWLEGISYCWDLEVYRPKLLDFPRYAGELERYRQMREAQDVGDYVVKETGSGRAPGEVLSEIKERLGLLVETLGTGDTEHVIQCVEDLENIFDYCEPLEFLVKPELPTGGVTYLAGDSEAGKTTLACAWARDLLDRGHTILLLDRDRNPRERIKERFERLGVTAHNPLLAVWDGQQTEEAAQPNAPIVLDWVRRMKAKTGLSPVVIVDSLISFLLPAEEENSSKDIRSLYNRCRAACSAGATVILLHHLGKDGQVRGSSDFKPAGDQGFIVTNFDVDGGRKLCKITLTVHKSRYMLEAAQIWNYAGGKMVRDESHRAADTNVTEQLISLLRTNPGINSKKFGDAAVKRKITSRERARDFLAAGVLAGTIRRETHKNNEQCHYLVDSGADSGADFGSPEDPLKGQWKNGPN